MASVSQIQEYLESLKLTGMQEALESRLAEAEQQNLSYMELLELLLEDEMRRRGLGSLGLRLKQTGPKPAEEHEADVLDMRARLLANDDMP